MNKENSYYFELKISSNRLELFSNLLVSLLCHYDDIVMEDHDDFIKLYCEYDKENDLLDLIDALNYFKSKLEKTIKDEQNLSITLDLETSKHNNKDWVLEFEKSIEPILISNFFIKTSFHESKDGYENIEINPSLAFGTGHHFTTASIIKNLAKYCNKNQSLIDVGCGSGILSIVASKLGLDVVSCDIDEMAIKVSKENFAKNNINHHIFLGSINDHKEKYDIILANLVSDVIIALKSDFKKILKKDAYVFFSGILYKNKNRVLEKYKFLSLVEEIVSSDGDWITLILRNNIEER